MISVTEPAAVIESAPEPCAITRDYNLETNRFGMWVFLAMETLFFSGVFMIYFAERARYPEAFSYGSHQLDLWLGTINTAVLLTSSWAVAAAVYACEKGNAYRAANLCLSAAGLGVVFLVIKACEFHADFTHALFPVLNFVAPAGAPAQLQLFMNLYLFTVSLHALHLIGGITWLTILAVLVKKNAPSIRGWHSRIEVAALYWHFIDLVWIFIFPLYYLIGAHR